MSEVTANTWEQRINARKRTIHPNRRPIPLPWHTLAPAAVQALSSNGEQGLSEAQAAERLMTSGPNELVEGGGRSAWQLLWEQLTAVMVLILLAAAVLSLLWASTWRWCSRSHRRALPDCSAFSRSTAPKKRLRRSKSWPYPPCVCCAGASRAKFRRVNLVPGDVVTLEAGNVVPADVRILTSANLRIQEAALTGESEAVEKNTEPLSHADVPWATAATWATWARKSPMGAVLAVLVVAHGDEHGIWAHRFAAASSGCGDDAPPAAA